MDDLQRSLLNVFSNCALDRVVPRRKDQQWFESICSHASTKIVPFYKGRFLLEEQPTSFPVWLSSTDLEEFNQSPQIRIFLGMRNSVVFIAIDYMEPDVVVHYEAGSRKFADLRQCGSLLHPQEASVLSYAKALFHWHRAHQYCGLCGWQTEPAQAGHVRVCGSEQCGRTHFPRTDPAIIVAVTDDNRCLFGRQPSWAPNRYSVIAGFVEPGESLEQAVQREVMEETNISLESIRYRSSQPWPFPGSIMLGFNATANSTAVSLNDGELADAHWRSAAQVVEGLMEGTFALPPQLSIAYRLIEEWFNSNHVEPLTELLDRTDKHTELMTLKTQ